MEFLNTIYRRLPTWRQIFGWLFVSRWIAPIVNSILAIIIFLIALNSDAGPWRDWHMVLTGFIVGVIFLGLITPIRIYHLSAEQKKATSDDVALIMIEAARRAEEVYGGHFPVPTEQPPPTSRLN
jgi:hypothetical protein